MEDALVHPLAIVDSTAAIGRGSVVEAFAIVGPGVRIGSGCRIVSHARLHSGVRIGDGVMIGHGAVIGGMPQVRDFHEPSRGKCVVLDEVRIGEYVTIHAASSPDAETTIGARSFLMAYAHVGHDCVLEEGVTLANAVQLGGHVSVGRHAFLGGAALIHQFCRVGELAFVAGGIPVDRDVLPWSRVIGLPAGWARMNLVGLRRAGWTSERIARAGRWLRPIVRKGGSLEVHRGALLETGDADAMVLDRFLGSSHRGIIRARV
jgi:UDP-N-acetylglucosamine acyltransferase